MGVYYISPSKESDWQHDPMWLTEKLRERWPDVSITEVSNPEIKRVFEWTIRMEHGEVEGALMRSKQSVRLDGDLRDCAEFASWLRSQVDNKYGLIFYDEGFEADVDLSAHKTPEQIVENFG